MSNKPLILSDNYFDNGVLHPEHLVTTGAPEVAGAELFHIADNLRDLTHFTTSATTDIVAHVDCGAAKPADMLVLDRGHNLGGAGVYIESSDDDATWTTRWTSALPSTPGGLPAGGVRASSGVTWVLFSSATARYWRLRTSAPFTPIVTGLYLGASFRFPTYLEAPGAYDYRTTVKVLKNSVSQGGLRVKRGILLFDEVDLRLELDGDDYAAFDPHVRRLLAANHPWWFVLDDNDSAGAQGLRLFQIPGDLTYDPVSNPVHRKVAFLLEEVAPALTL